MLPDIFIEHDKPEKMYGQAGLNAPEIMTAVLAALGGELGRGTQAELPERRHLCGIHRNSAFMH